MLTAVVLGTVLGAILPIWFLAPPPMGTPPGNPPILVAARSTGGSLTNPREELLGRSTGGAPVRAYWVGDGPDVVVVQGGFHGGPERNTAALALQLRDYFRAHPEGIP